MNKVRKEGRRLARAVAGRGAFTSERCDQPQQHKDTAHLFHRRFFGFWMTQGGERTRWRREESGLEAGRASREEWRRATEDEDRGAASRWHGARPLRQAPHVSLVDSQEQSESSSGL